MLLHNILHSLSMSSDTPLASVLQVELFDCVIKAGTCTFVRPSLF